MSNEVLTPEILRGGEVERRRFDPRTAAPFVNKSVSEETRRAYRRTLSEFFQFIAGKHPADVTPSDVMLWRDGLRSRRRKPATVALLAEMIASRPNRSAPPPRGAASPSPASPDAYR